MFPFFRKKERPDTETTGESKQGEGALAKELEKNMDRVKEIFRDDDTVIFREFANQAQPAIRCVACFVDGMVNNTLVNENIIKPVMLNTLLKASAQTLDNIQMQVLFSNDVKKSEDIDEIIQAVLYGDTALFVDGFPQALIINSKGWQMKSISEPDAEKALRGSHEGFIESILVNTSLIRRRIKNSQLKFKFQEMGTRSHTKVCLCYIENLIDPKTLEELQQRLSKINMDGVLDSNYLAENIKDSKWSLFKTIGVTERPDSVAGKLLEGRVAILVDGSPEVLTVPYLFIENFQASDDYYINYYFSSIGRTIRVLSFLVSISIPAVYVALVNFHKEMIPTSLVVSIAQSHAGVPFPTIIECVLMLMIFEVIREAGLRMPSNIGQALSLVGALVIGQAAVEANIISAPMVIVVAGTAISGLINTRLKGATIIIRLEFIVLASIIGLYGYAFGMIWLLIHLLSIKSFGINYLSQGLSFHTQDQKDIFIRGPWWMMKKRPNFMSPNRVRQRAPGEETK